MPTKIVKRNGAVVELFTHFSPSMYWNSKAEDLMKKLNHEKEILVTQPSIEAANEYISIINNNMIYFKGYLDVRENVKII